LHLLRCDRFALCGDADNRRGRDEDQCRNEREADAPGGTLRSGGDRLSIRMAGEQAGSRSIAIDRLGRLIGQFAPGSPLHG
jgi:hypothetical protein